MKFRRVILIVLDSVGIGEMPDAAAYGDAGSDTLGHIALWRPLILPHFRALGLANIRPLANLRRCPSRSGRLAAARWPRPARIRPPAIGRWPAYSSRSPFPALPATAFRPRSWTNSSGASAAAPSATTPPRAPRSSRISARSTWPPGSPIVYTSADSVFQVAAHEDVIPLPELDRICAAAREILHGPHQVGRVIARPFVGRPAPFTRDNAGRHDYAVAPPQGMLLDRLAGARRSRLRRRQDLRHLPGPRHQSFGKGPRQRRRQWPRRWTRCRPRPTV